MDEVLIDPAALRRLRLETGSGFARILGWFREEGLKSLRQIEGALGARNAAALVLPAHSLKGEALQFGAAALAAAAERVEMAARSCVEAQTGPERLVADVGQLRPLFERTMALLATMTASAAPPSPPAAARGQGFGRRTFGTAVR